MPYFGLGAVSAVVVLARPSLQVVAFLADCLPSALFHCASAHSARGHRAGRPPLGALADPAWALVFCAALLGSGWHLFGVCPVKGASTSGIGHKGSSALGTGHNSPAPCGLRTRPAPLGALRAAAKDRDTGAVDGSTAARDPLTAAKATRRASWRRSQVSPGPPAGSDASSATAKFG